MKADARKNGIKPPEGIKPAEVKDADLKKVSVERLTARLGLTKYDVNAPLTEDFDTRTVKIPLAQGIGVPAVACVNEGDKVKCGEVIAKVPDNALGADVHASIDGKVTTVTERYIKITK